mgnify:CR=1 FL=1
MAFDVKHQAQLNINDNFLLGTLNIVPLMIKGG